MRKTITTFSIPLMQRGLIALLCGILPYLSVHGAAVAQADTQTITKIDDTVIEGNRHVDAVAIRAQLTKTSGPITRAEIGDDIRKLYTTGYFDQVTASFVTEGNKKILRYVVVEKPLVRKVFIRGNKEVSESDLGDVIQTPGKKFVDRAFIDSQIRTLVAYYQSQGFYDAKATSAINPVGESQVDITLEVEEGERFRIREVNFRGLKEVDESELRDAVQTKRYKWWSSWLLGTGRLSVDMVNNDQVMVRQYLLDKGYVDASVGEPVIEKRDDGLYINFDVVEGVRYRLGEIRVQGDLIDDSPKKTLEGIKSVTGEFFGASKVRDDAFLVSEKFTDVGFAFANVVPNTNIDSKDHIVNIEFNVNKGKIVRVNRINIKGNDKTYDNVIRRQMRIDEQELYSSSKVKRSQTLLQRLGYFEEVTISTEPTGDDETVDLNVGVREGSTGSFSAGVGYSSGDGALFNSRLSEENLFGTGRRLTLNVDLGTERNNYIISYGDDRFRDTYVSMGADLYRTEREFTDFDRNLTGTSMQFGYPLEEIFGSWMQDISGSIKYEYINVDIRNVDPNNAAQLVIDSEGTSTASGITPRLVRNTINNPLNPTSGSRQIVSLEMTGLGGSEEYYLFEARHTSYTPLLRGEWGDITFAFRTTFGYGEAYDSDESLPLFRRYFPGGINSVRGYKDRTLGPTDENGNEYGGAKELVSNFEVIFPLVNSAGLKAVVFYDVGEAFDDNVSIDLGDLREAYGFGFRWGSPLGPIRIEFGYPVDREPGERSMITMFSFGAPL